MSDDDKKELDNYGVWVKKPPVDSENDTASADDAFSLDTELPDFSEITTDSAPSSGGEEEISLDEFIDGGVFEGDEQPTQEASPAPEAAPATEESIDLSEFGFEDTAEDTAGAAEPVPTPEADDTMPVALDDDQPLDIDLSFDDDGDTAPATDSVTAEPSAGDDSSMESIDLSDFGFGDENTESAPESTEATAAGATEEVDLSEFGFDDSAESSDAGAEVAPSAENAVADSAADADEGMESVDLSEFGFDEDTESSENESPVAPVAETAPQEPTATPAADEVAFSVSLDDEENVPMTMPAIEETPLEAEEFSVQEQAAEALSDATPEADEPSLEQAAPTAQPEEVAAQQNETIAQPAASTADAATESAASILSQLVGELHSLKDEIASLKSDFEAMKNRAPEAPALSEPVTSEAAPEAEAPIPFAEDNDVLPADVGIAGEEPAPFAEDDDELPLTESAPSAEPASDESEAPEAPLENEETVAEAAEPALEPVDAESETAESAVDELASSEDAIPQTDSSNAGGFFGDDDGDDTIALSLDELGNILNSADFTEASVEEATEDTSDAPEELAAETEEATTADDETVSVLGQIDENETVNESVEEEGAEPQMDFATDNLEEPVFEEFADTAAEPETNEASPLPEEISVPVSETEATVDDVVVTAEDEEPLSDEAMQYLNASPSAEESLTPEETEEPVEELAQPLEAVEPTVEAPAEAASESAEDAAQPTAPQTVAETASAPVAEASDGIPGNLRQEIKSVLSYMDQLLENLPEDKIAEFAQSDQFETYKKLFKELGLA